jgi:trigger factor
MNVSFNNRDAVSGVLKIEVTKEDYAAKIESSLRELRRTVVIPGFRKGMTPVGLVAKMYGKKLLIEEIDKLVSEKLVGYLSESGIRTLGDPIPNETEQKEHDFNTQEDFEFCFDIAINPGIQHGFSKDDHLAYYKVEVDDEMTGKQIETYQASYGTYDAEAEEVEEKDMIKGKLTELENGTPKEEGLVVEDAVLMPMHIINEEEKNIFIGAAKGSTLTFNPHKAYEGAEASIASLLKIDKAEAAGIVSDFSLEIDEITHYKEAELNQDLYDKVCGEGIATDEETFREKVRAMIAEQYDAQSDRKFYLDARPLFLEKAKDIVLADDILKRWLLFKGEYTSMEEIEENYPQVFEDTKYSIVKEDIVKDNIEVKPEDVEDLARQIVIAQLNQYGMYSVSEDMISNYAKNMMQDKKTLSNIVNRVTEDKLAVWLKDAVTVDIKNVSIEEFIKILQSDESIEQEQTV